MTQGWKSQRSGSIRVQVPGPGPGPRSRSPLGVVTQGEGGGEGGSAADSEVIRPLGGVFRAVDAKV
jgi:hypothetical protein